MKHDQKIVELTRMLGGSLADRYLDANLQRIYSDMQGEPLPDKFSQLLDRLRQAGHTSTH